MHKENLLPGKIFLLRDFLTAEECQQFIDQSEDIGYDEAPITTAAGFVMRKDIRNNARVILDDVDLAERLFARAKDFLPPEWFGWELVGFNERFRFYRYDVGQRFAPHTDGHYERENGERSHLTFMIYLNEDFEGGWTSFQRMKAQGSNDSVIDVEPATGLALVFYHRLIHEGVSLSQGRKYVLRTDLMYRRIDS